MKKTKSPLPGATIARRKTIACLLCLMLLLTLMTGCKTAPTDTSETSKSTTLESTPASSAPDTTPSVDVTGYVFRLKGSHIDKYIPIEGSSELHDRWIAELNEMQATYGFTLELDTFESTMESVITHVMSGDDVTDFLLQRHSDFFVHAVHGRVRPLDGEELIAAGFQVWDEEKWDPVYTAISEFDGHIWGVMTNGEYYLACFDDVLCFNPLLTAKAGYDADAIYDLVRKKEWTWDKYLEIARAVAEDTDGDGINDVWGTGAGIFQFGEMLVTNGFMPIYQDSGGKWVAEFTNPKYLNALDFILEATSPEIRDASLGTGGGPFKQAFAEGKIAFNQFYGWNFWEEPLTQAEFPFGVIPTPIGKDTDNYVSVLPEIDSWTMLSTTKEVEKAVFCMNLWGDIMTNDRWITRTKNECFRDEASWEMFENYIYPNTKLNWQQATKETWQYIRENIVTGVLVDRKSATAATEGHDPVLQAMLDETFNKK